MYVDLPQFKRCCLCIPLRHGLLAWGYIKLMISILFLIFVSLNISFNAVNVTDLCIITAILIIVLVEIAFNIVLVVGAHKKNHKLIRVYYYYSIVGFAALVLLATYNLGHSIYLMIVQCRDSFGSFFYLMILSATAAVTILEILLQFYVILLVRSEIFKLKSGRSFMFVNVTANDGACAMSADDKELQEKVKYDRLQDDV